MNDKCVDKILDVKEKCEVKKRSNCLKRSPSRDANNSSLCLLKEFAVFLYPRD